MKPEKIHQQNPNYIYNLLSVYKNKSILEIVFTLNKKLGADKLIEMFFYDAINKKYVIFQNGYLYFVKNINFQYGADKEFLKILFKYIPYIENDSFYIVKISDFLNNVNNKNFFFEIDTFKKDMSKLINIQNNKEDIEFLKWYFKTFKDKYNISGREVFKFIETDGYVPFELIMSKIFEKKNNNSEKLNEIGEKAETLSDILELIEMFLP